MAGPFVFEDPAIRDLGVIDAESFWVEPADLWSSRAPAKFKDRVPQLIHVPKGRQWFGGDATLVVDRTVGRQEEDTAWVVEGRIEIARGTNCAFNTAGEKLQIARGLMRHDRVWAAATEVAPRLQMLDQQGIQTQVVYPNAAGLSGAHFLGRTGDAELALECVKIYNDAVAELQEQSGGRLLFQGLLPVHTGEAAAAELRRATEELKLTGFAITDDLPSVGRPDWADESWAPFWEAADSIGAPLGIRVGGNLVDQSLTTWPSYSAEEEWAIYNAPLALSMGPTIGNFGFSGIFDRYPNARMVLVGAGIGWLPFYLEIADYQLTEMVGDDTRAEDRPSEYFRRNWWVTFCAEQSAVKHGRDGGMIPGDHIMFSTRFPLPVSLSSRSTERVNATLARLTEDERRTALRDNAAGLYGLAAAVPA